MAQETKAKPVEDNAKKATRQVSIRDLQEADEKLKGTGSYDGDQKLKVSIVSKPPIYSMK